MPRLRLDGICQIVFRQLPVENKRNFHRRRVADRLRQQSDHVVEIRRRPETTVPPRGIARPGTHRGSRLPLGHEPRMHGRADHFDAKRHQRVEVVVERIAERRCEHDGAGRTGLVVVIDDLRKPFPIRDPVHVFRFRLGRHVEVAIVVVPHVLLIQHGNPRRRTLFGNGITHVPV